MVGKSTMVGIRAAPLAIEWISRSRGMPPTIRHSAQFAKVQILAYVFEPREDETFLRLQELLAPFGITRFYTDGWGAYRRHLDPSTHTVGKQHTQKIERKHITFRTRIKRLTRKTICFSRSILMHDLVIGLFINRYEFGYAV